MIDTHMANGARFIAKDDVIVRWLRQERGKDFEPDTLQWMLARLEERAGAYLDVGASTGWFAIPVAQRGRKTIAVECNPRVLQRLRENMALNAAEIEVHDIAASDHIGDVTFHSNPKWPLTSGGSLEAGIRSNLLTETVRAAPLDSIAGDQTVALMKIDVEGHEIAVLAGACGLIERDRPFMVLEANTASHEADLYAFLTEAGYTYIKADHRNMLCSPA